MCVLCERGSLLRACADAEKFRDGRLIHRAAGVLDAVSHINMTIDRMPKRERETMESLMDELKDLACEMRRHHDAIKLGD